MIDWCAGFEGHTEKHQYSIVGHSGESSAIELVGYASPPKNAKERMDVLDQLHAHAQYCLAGDNTLTAASKAVRDVVRDLCVVITCFTRVYN